MSSSWRGVNHLALVTPDMDTTVRFYAGVLGMRLAATLLAGPMRHYFFEIGDGSTLAFFEVNGAATFTKPAGAPTDRTIQLDHVSFGVAGETALEALRQRLLAADCEVTDVIDHSIVRSIYFNDPNGIALEASWWVIDPTRDNHDFDDRRVFSDPEPVAAVAELRAGTLQSTPITTLA